MNGLVDGLRGSNPTWRVKHHAVLRRSKLKRHKGFVVDQTIAGIIIVILLVWSVFRRSGLFVKSLAC